MSKFDLYLSKSEVLLNGKDVKVPGTYARRLRIFQNDAIRFLHNQYLSGKGAILNDENGLGKTVQTILYIYALHLTIPNIFSLVICKRNNLDHWFYHVQKWSDLTVSKFNEEKTKSNVTISTIDDISLIQKYDWHVIVIDDLDVNNVMKDLHKLKCNFKIWLTGMNLLNNLKRLHGVLKWISPEFTVSLKNFEDAHRVINEDREKYWKEYLSLVAFCNRWLLRRTRNSIADRLPLTPPDVYEREFLAWKDELNRSNQIDEANSQSDSLEILDESQNVVEINDSTDSEESGRPASPSLLDLSHGKIKCNDGDNKRKGTKDASGSKIKKSRSNNSSNVTENGDGSFDTSCELCENDFESKVDEQNELSDVEKQTEIRNIDIADDAMEEISPLPSYCRFKMLDDILFNGK